jgi:curved DNA-binding protein CbpA
MTETSSSRARRRAADRSDAAVGDDPFALLGLAPRPGLSDDDVRAAWRRIAAATHPDREDGGDPARFGAAAGAYVVLRTGFGRSEALADLGLSGTPGHRRRHAHRRSGPADPSSPGAGRHRARRQAPVDWPIRVRLPRLTRLRNWMAQRAATRDPANEASPDLTNATGRRPGGASASRRWMQGRSSNWQPAGFRLGRRSIRPPGGLALRVTGVAALALVTVAISGWSPGAVGVLAGVLSWLLAIAGRAFSRRRSRPPF